MNFVKGIGLVLLGIVIGFFTRSVWLENEVDTVLDTHQEIQKTITEAVASSNKQRFEDLASQIIDSYAFLESYKNGADLKKILFTQLDSLNEELSFYRQMEDTFDSESLAIFKELETQISRLEEDIEFYFGPL